MKSASPVGERPASDDATAPGKGERRRRRKKRRIERKEPVRKTTKLALAVGAIVGALLVAIIFVYPHLHGPGDGKSVSLDLAASNSGTELGAQLEKAGVLSSPHLFAIYAWFARANPGAIAGPHFLTDDLSPAEVLARIERRGAATRVHVTFPEGYTRFDMARRLQDKRVCSEEAFLRATSDATALRALGIEGDSAEGYLFPATYELAADADPTDIVSRLKLEFDRRFQALVALHELGKSDLETSLGFTVRDIVTMASMIEKEAAVDDERPIIASVFLNRLRDPSFKRKVLQSDPTSAYGCLVMRDQIKACAGFTGKITHDLNMDPGNLYSTYVHEKLPPGPICNPGARSLEAVLGPARTKYLYFVARGEGRHTFSESYESHTNAIKKDPQ